MFHLLLKKFHLGPFPKECPYHCLKWTEHNRGNGAIANHVFLAMACWSCDAPGSGDRQPTTFVVLQFLKCFYVKTRPLLLTVCHVTCMFVAQQTHSWKRAVTDKKKNLKVCNGWSVYFIVTQLIVQRNIIISYTTQGARWSTLQRS